jgi:hypothetical protein
MTHEEMLKRMGLTHEELKDLLLKLAQLHVSLNEHQRAVLDRSLPTASKAAKTFGADVTAADLERFLSAEVYGGFATGCVVALQGHNQ